MVKDPVCGMEIDVAWAARKLMYEGETYYFCAPGCLLEFVNGPEKYVHVQGLTGKGLHEPAPRINDDKRVRR